MPAVRNDLVLTFKKYKKDAARSEILKKREVTDTDIAKMYSWQQETPLGSARFRWKTPRQYIYDYEDNGYV